MRPSPMLLLPTHAASYESHPFRARTQFHSISAQSHATTAERSAATATAAAMSVKILLVLGIRSSLLSAL